MNKDQVIKLIEAACLAPSVDNCQPWHFVCSEDTIDIFLDRQRAEFFGDYDFAASYATIGAVVENMRIAASHSGVAMRESCFPSGNADHIVSLQLTENTLAPDLLFPYLKLRCTNRRKYQKSPLFTDQRDALQKAADSIPGATLHLFEDRDTMKKMFRMAAEIDSIIFSHPLLHANLFRWIRWTDHEIETTRDGMPVGSLEIDLFQKLFFRIISSFGMLRCFNLFGTNRLVGLLNSALLLNSSSVGLLVMDGTSHIDYLNGGKCMERIWLTATAKGLSFQPFGGLPFLLTRMLRGGEEGFSKAQYTSLQAIYAKLQQLVPVSPANGLIILFRIGTAETPSKRSIRRSIADVSSYPN